MKSVLLSLLILACGAIDARAGDIAMAATMPDPVRPTHTITGGVIKTVTWADITKGTKSEIVVQDAAKRSTHILITSTTTIWDANVMAALPERIVPKARVNVIYFTTPEGVNIGKSIKLVK